MINFLFLLILIQFALWKQGQRQIELLQVLGLLLVHLHGFVKGRVVVRLGYVGWARPF